MLTFPPGAPHPLPTQNDPIPVFNVAGAVAGEDPFHLFFMCDPGSPIAPWAPGGASAWCHAHSPDMLTAWTFEAPALPPPSAPGTGSVVPLAYVAANASGLPVGTGAALFTSGASLALSSIKDALLVNWTAVTGPVVPNPPPSSNCSMIGDVSVASRVNAGGVPLWQMVIGSSTGDGMKTGDPALLLYESQDLKTWWGGVVSASACGHPSDAPPPFPPLSRRFISVLYIGPASNGPRMEVPVLPSLLPLLVGFPV